MRFMKIWGAMLVLMFTVAVVSGCAMAQMVATEGLVASDATADAFADEWLEGTQRRVDACRAREPAPATEAERKECLGLFAEGDKAEAALKVLIAVQQSVVVAVQCSQKSIQSPADVKVKCLGRDKPDWIKLATDLKSAWNALLPYVEAARAEVKQ